MSPVSPTSILNFSNCSVTLKNNSTVNADLTELDVDITED